MKKIGFIKQHENDNTSRDINEYFKSDENIDRDILLKYLENGVICVPLMGGVDDYFDDEDDNFVAYMYVYTDGEWFWPHYIIEYLRKYPKMHLDEEFTNYVRGNNSNSIKVSDNKRKELEQLYFSDKSWQNDGE